MKEYTVWYITKQNNRGYLHCYITQAANKKEAFELTELHAQSVFNRHAFAKSTKPPEWDGGEPGDLERRNLSYDGCTYTRASKYGKQIVLW